MLRKSIFAFALCCLMAGHAWATGILRLVPANPGPYNGNESFLVDIFLDNNTNQQLFITFVRLNYTNSTVLLPPVMEWTLSPSGAGNPNLPVPDFSAPSPTLNILPPMGSIQLGRVRTTLPDDDGCYVLDVMHVPAGGGGTVVVLQGIPGIPVIWLPSNGTLSGGHRVFKVGAVGGMEVCNDLDDDCDGLIDEDYFEEQFDPDTGGTTKVGPGGTCVIGVGNCEVPGRLVCSPDGTDLICVPGQTPLPPRIEGPYGAPNCSDLEDNDCDGLVDFEDPDCQGPELCDGFDNNNDGEVDELWPELGQDCTVGQGPCQRTGTYICRANQTGTECSAQPAQPGIEGPPGSFRCSDGFDNDCDGLKDLDDPDCQEPEKCDGKDNDGNGEVDELWPQLGQSCTVGIGACERTGVFVCRPDGTGTQCSVTPGAKSPEGPGCDCGDGIDNDCDGLIDLDDPDCGGSILRVQAALPEICRNHNGECRSMHHVDWTTLNGGPALVESVDLLAMDAKGQILDSAPVSANDVVRITPRDDVTQTTVNSFLTQGSLPYWENRWEPCLQGPSVALGAACSFLDTDCDNDLDLADVADFQLRFGQSWTVHDIVAQRPVLRVNADNGMGLANAYVSPVPHVRVWSPDETVVSLSEGDRVRAEIQLSNVELAALELYIDGVAVFAALGLNPATDFPGGPYGGNVVLPNGCSAQICELIVDAADVNTLSANTLRMYVENMCCGGHRLVARAPELIGSYPLPAPLACAQPLTNDSGLSYGFEVDVTSPADHSVDPAPPTAVLGSVCHGLPLDSPTPSVDGFVRINAGLVPVFLSGITVDDGVFTATTYRYLFQASLPQTNIFQEMIGNAVAGTLDHGSNYIIAEARDPLLNTTFDVVPMAVGPLAPAPAPAIAGAKALGSNGVPHGFSVTATAAGLSTIVTAALQPLVDTVIQDVENMLTSLKGSTITIPTSACDVNASLLVDDPVPFQFTADPNDFTFDVVPSNDKLDVVVTSGLMEVDGSVRGSCKITGLFGECFIRVRIKVGAEVDIDKVVLKVGITEDDLINKNPLNPTLNIDNNDIHINVSDVSSKVECWGGVLAQILSLGTINLIVNQVVENKIDDYLADLDVTEYLGLIPVPPIPLDVLDFDPVNIESLDVAFNFDLTEVQINPSGLTAGFMTEFVPTQVDDEIPALPGLPDTIAALPLPILPNAQALQLTALVADDAINQLFHALTRNGILKTQFEDVRQLKDLLPANCNTLPTGQLGQCAAIQGISCPTLVDPNDQTACLTTTFLLSSLNLSDTTPILLHGKLNVPPKFMVFRTNGPDEVVVVIRLMQAFAGIVADRDGDGMFTGDYSSIKSCYTGTPPSNDQCALWATCFNVNYTAELTLGSGPGGVPRLTFSVVDSEMTIPTACAGGVVVPGGNDAFNEIFEGMVFDLIRDYVDNNVPPFDLPLDFDGIIDLQNLKTIIHGNTFDPVFDDTFGLTLDPAAP